MNAPLYNCDQVLWENTHKAYSSYPNGGPILTLHDGNLGNRYEILARFENNAHGQRVLLAAGFREVNPNNFKA